MALASIGIPRSPTELTAQWLTDALRAGGAIRESSVASIEQEIVGAGSGFIGQLARVKLTYDRAEGGAPSTLIAKFPAIDPGGKQIGMLFRFYERESRFYSEIADKISIRVPRCYYNGIDLDAGEFILLLEDMAPAVVGDHLESCVIEHARLVIGEIGKFHAEWWQSPQLDALAWMPLIDDPVQLSAEQAYQAALPSFVERFRDYVPAEMLPIAERFSSRVSAQLHKMASRPRTIVHGDFRLDNMFFGGPQGGAPLAIIDWQISTRGLGTFDVGYFMSGNLDVDVRRQHEQEFLHLYHDALRAGGVKDYSFDELMEDYRASVMFCLVYNVIGAGDLDPANDRGLAMWRAWIDRTAAAILDLNAQQTIAD